MLITNKRVLTDDGDTLLVDDATGQQMEIEFGALDDDCVAGIIASLLKQQKLQLLD